MGRDAGLQTLLQVEDELRALQKLTPVSEVDYAYITLALSLLWSIPLLWQQMSNGLIWILLKILALGGGEDSKERKDKWHRRGAWLSFFGVSIVSGIVVICIALLKPPGQESFAGVIWATIGGLTLAESLGHILEHTPEYTGAYSKRVAGLKTLGCSLLSVARVLMALNFLLLAPDSAKFNNMYFYTSLLLLLSIIPVHLVYGEHGLKMIASAFTSLSAYLIVLIAGVLQSGSVVLPSYFIRFDDVSVNAYRGFLLLSWIVACAIALAALIAVAMGYCLPGLMGLVGGSSKMYDRNSTTAGMTSTTHAAHHYSRPTSSSHHGHRMAGP